MKDVMLYCHNSSLSIFDRFVPLRGTNLSDKIELFQYNKKTNHLLEIVFYFSKKEKENRIDNKIKHIWKLIIETIKNEKDKYQKVLFSLSYLLKKIDSIDEDVYKWLKISAQSVQSETQFFRLTKNLFKHLSNEPIKLREIFFEMISSGKDIFFFYPQYIEKEIKTIVEALYKNGRKELAKKISNLYAEKGHYFLRDIYKEN